MMYSVENAVSDTGTLEEVIAMAHRMQGHGAVADLLRLSAALLEHCAYELARSESRGQVSRIILISAELERMARDTPPR